MLLYNKVKFNEVIMFYRQFAVMLKAGISISDCLHNLEKQNFSKAFKKVIESIYLDVDSGVYLSEAFSRHPKAFPKFFVSMVSIGEVSGALDEIMTSMADYYENDRKIRKKVSSAMVYPTLLTVMIFFVTIFLFVFIVPQFESTITQFGGEVPKITIIIMNVSQFFQKYILFILLGFAIVLMVILAFLNTKEGHYIKDVIKINIPLISKIEKNLITSRFSKAFVILLGSGMNMIDILENLTKMLGNQVFERKFKYAINDIKSGKRIAASIEETKLFPKILTEMIKVGENSGNLEEVLKSTGSYFDDEVENSIAKVVATIEPIAIIVIGFVVTLVLLSVVIPMIAMMKAV